MIFAVAISRVIGWYMLMSFVRHELNPYWRKIKNGEIRKAGAVNAKAKYA